MRPRNIIFISFTNDMTKQKCENSTKQKEVDDCRGIICKNSMGIQDINKKDKDKTIKKKRSKHIPRRLIKSC